MNAECCIRISGKREISLLSGKAKWSEVIAFWKSFSGYFSPDEARCAKHMSQGGVYWWCKCLRFLAIVKSGIGISPLYSYEVWACLCFFLFLSLFPPNLPFNSLYLAAESSAESGWHFKWLNQGWDEGKVSTVHCTLNIIRVFRCSMPENTLFIL